jgi:hypothetical protein
MHAIDSSAERQSRDARCWDNPAGQCQPERLGFAVEVTPYRAAFRPSCLGDRVCPHAAHPRQVDHASVVAHGIPGHAMAAASNRDEEVVLPTGVPCLRLLEFLRPPTLGTRVEARLFRGRNLADVEVTQGSEASLRAGEASVAFARADAIADLTDLDFHRHPHLDLLARAWKLRMRSADRGRRGAGRRAPGVLWGQTNKTSNLRWLRLGCSSSSGLLNTLRLSRPHWTISATDRAVRRMAPVIEFRLSRSHPVGGTGHSDREDDSAPINTFVRYS